MKKQLKKKTIFHVYAVMRNARLGSLKKNEEKTAVLRVLRELRCIANRYEEDAREIAEKLKPDGFDEQQGRAALYEVELNSGKKPTATSDADYQDFLARNLAYTRSVAYAMRDLDAATVELDFQPLSAPILEQLMDTNGWTADEFLRVEEAITLQENEQP